MFKEFNRVHDKKEIVHVCMNMQNLITKSIRDSTNRFSWPLSQ